MSGAGNRLSAGRAAACVLTRVAQLGLIALGVGFVFSSDTAGSDLAWLIGWDLLVFTYLGIGFAVARRRRTRPDLARPDGRLGRMLTSARLSFGLAVVASLVGVGSLSSALSYGQDTTFGKAVKLFGGAAVIAAWLLLHTGYAGFYAWRYYEREAGPGDRADSHDAGGGLAFPHGARPMASDFLYFAFSVGTSFAVSDVSVTSQAMRWHVMVHSVLSFFYNAVVLVAAIGFLLGR